MAKKNALGRGLGALIDSEDQEKIEKIKIVDEIDVEDIQLNPFQPRKHFDEESLNELASSIRELGIVQPITVRKNGDNKYQLISGERRLRAAKIAGITKIPSYIRLADDNNLLELALVENIQREDLDAIEVAISYERLIDECNLTQEDLSQRVGKKRATISNYLRLLKLPAEVQLGIREKKLSMGHARAIINIEDPEKQLDIFNKIIQEDLSVRKVEELVKNLNAGRGEKTEGGTRIRMPEEYEELQSHLVKHFGANIQFIRNNKGAGKIVIPFKSDEDLERIIGIIDKLNS